jgi:hypothetical protein
MEPTLLNLKISENQPKIAGPPKIVEARGFEPRVALYLLPYTASV